MAKVKYIGPLYTMFGGKRFLTGESFDVPDRALDQYRGNAEFEITGEAEPEVKVNLVPEPIAVEMEEPIAADAPEVTAQPDVPEETIAPAPMPAKRKTRQAPKPPAELQAKKSRSKKK